MKNHRNHQPVIAAAGAWLFSNVVVGSRALLYVCSAQQDERRGFPYTAATEWRSAAELFSSQKLTEYCWRHWERIMRLPRRLAGPISISQLGALSLQPASAERLTMTPEINQLSFAKAA